MTIVKWDKYHCLGMSLVAIAYLFTSSITTLLIPAIISFSYLLVASWSTLKKPIPGGSYANWVTISRFLGLIAVGFLWTSLTNLQTSIILGILAILDGVDGFLARKFKQKSAFGAYFDMETDAFYVCLVSAMVFQKGITGGWILIPGFMRYIFIASVYLFSLNIENDKRTKFGPAIATVMFIALCCSFVLPQKTASVILIISSVLLVLSFGYSFLQIWQKSKRTSN